MRLDRDQFDHHPVAGRSSGRRVGFTLIEMLIVVVILGILATIVLPQFSNASHQARQNTLKDDLRYLRTQIMVYSAQHREVAPGYVNGNPAGAADETSFIAQMTSYTDESSNVSATQTATAKLGPYLTRIPVNPINGMSKIKVIQNGAAMPAPDGTSGWIYKPQTREIIANLTGNDESGRAYSDY